MIIKDQVHSYRVQIYNQVLDQLRYQVYDQVWDQMKEDSDDY